MEVGSAYNYEQLLDSVKEQALSKIGGDKMAKISSFLGQAGLINAELSQFGFYKQLGNMFKETANEIIQQVNPPTIPLGTEGTGLKEFSNIETETSPQVKEVSKGIFGREILGDKPLVSPAPAPQLPTPRPALAREPQEPLFSIEQAPRPLQTARPPVPIENDPEYQRLSKLRDEYTQSFNDTKKELQSRADRLESEFSDFVTEVKEKTGVTITDPTETQFALERDDILKKGALAQEAYDADLQDINQKLADREASLRRINAEPPRFRQETTDPLLREADVPTPVRPPRTERPVTALDDVVEDVANKLVVPTEVESDFSDFLSGARANLAANVEGMTQSVRGSLFGRASQLYDKAISYKQSLESGVDRISTLRNQATDYAQQLRNQAGDIEAQGRSLIQQGQDALSRGEQAGQDFVNQGQGLLNKALEQSTNSELFQTAMDTAQSKISQGQQLLNDGKQEGMKLLQEGQEQLEQAQSAIKGYGGQARQFGQQIQTEIEGRSQQLNDLAENLMSQAKTGMNSMSDIGNAVKTGDVEGAVEGTQNLVKTAGQLAEKAGIAGGEETAATIAEAIPVVGEIASAGLLIASLFTGFEPHEKAQPIMTATSAYGV